ncbi:MAG: nitrite/sulfite reductase, partial [Pseudomonadota bacterium]
LSYLEAVMRVYNRHGRRDNKYKARVKILVAELGSEAFTRQVEAEYAAQQPGEKVDLPVAEIERITAYFAPPEFGDRPAESDTFDAARADDPEFDRWCRINLHPHKAPGYASVTVSLKPAGVAPGDATEMQMRAVAELAREYGFDDLRVTHEQNLTLPHVALDDLYAVYQALKAAGLATANAGLVSDMICCPGLDYCNLANARSIPLAADIQSAFENENDQEDIGELKIKISGCINACGHHHAGHIGILGVDRKGEEYYQITFGGRGDEAAAIGEIAGPGLKQADVPAALQRVVETYKSVRSSKDERFIDAVERLGTDPFKEALYAAD